MVTGYTTVDYRKDSQEILDNTQVKTSDDGYTSAVASDALTNSDFMKLMLVEMQNQDPTDPMDTSAMMDNQLKMSQIESNINMSEAMTKLQAAFETSAFAGAANMIGRIADMSVEIENEETGLTEEVIKEYKIQSIIKQDGELFGKVNEVIGIKDNLYYEGAKIEYTSSGFMYENGELTDYRIKLDEDGRVITGEDGNPIIMDEDGNQITDETYLSKFAISGTEFEYGEEEILPLSSITRLS